MKPRARSGATSVGEIARAIKVLRGQRVLLDSELAALYGVETRVLNQAVKRNAERFPTDFRFQLTADEAAASRSQSVTLKPGRGQNIKFLPHAFTERGAIMAAGVLSSVRAVEISFYLVRAFVQLRELLASNRELAAYDEPITAMLSVVRRLMAGLSKPGPIQCAWCMQGRVVALVRTHSALQRP